MAPAWDVSKLVPALADLVEHYVDVDFLFICDDTSLVNRHDIALRLSIMNPDLPVVYGRASSADQCEGMEFFELEME